MNAGSRSSAAVRHFGAQRQHWWHKDFLALLARRLAFAAADRWLDVGCGIGHWTAALRPHFAPEATVVGVDREVAFAREAGSCMRTIVADASALPFADATFAAVTCQTLLVHVADASQVLAEMVRVARPGGLVLCVEPNQLLNLLDFDNVANARPVEELVRRFEFWLRAWHGRRQRGRGDLAVGTALPGLMQAAGLRNIRVFVGDQPATHLPPYDTPAEQAMIADQDEPDGIATLWLDEVRADVLAGGGDDVLVATVWREFAAYLDDRRAALRRGEFCTAGTGFLYVVAGRKQIHE